MEIKLTWRISLFWSLELEVAEETPWAKFLLVIVNCAHFCDKFIWLLCVYIDISSGNQLINISWETRQHFNHLCSFSDRQLSISFVILISWDNLVLISLLLVVLVFMLFVVLFVIFSGTDLFCHIDLLR